MAGVYNFEVKQGETFYRKFYWQSINQVPFNFDGCTPYMEIRKYDCNGEVLIDLSNKITVTPNYLELNMTWQDTLIFTNDLLLIPLVYDLFLEKDGNRYCFIEGNVTIECRRTKKDGL
jgi:hypothetical protein